MLIRIGIRSNVFSFGIEGKIFFFSKKLNRFFLLNSTLKFDIYWLFINFSSLFSQGKPLYMLLYSFGIIFFAFFYTSIVFNPKETAENLRKYGGYVPGIRPGERTADYIEEILIIALYVLQN